MTDTTYLNNVHDGIDGLVSIYQGGLSSLNTALDSCNTDKDTCNTNLDSCNGNLDSCNSNLDSCNSDLNTCNDNASNNWNLLYNGCVYSMNNLVTDVVNWATLYVKTNQAAFDTGGSLSDPFSFNSTTFCSSENFDDAINADASILTGTGADGYGLSVSEADVTNFCEGIISSYPAINTAIGTFRDIYDGACCAQYDC